MKSYLLSFFLCFAGIYGYAQNYEIKGKVVGSDGVPLPGVSIVVKNTTKGGSTDFDGNFAIANVSKGETLVFSYVGFTTKEIVVTNDAFLNITLNENLQSLEEVVVVGYGVQKKKEVTGAVSVVGSKTIEEINPVRVEEALQGQVAGVNITSQSGSPGSGSNIRIRGVSTNGNNNPLILVDGNIIEDLSVINPSDIQSINILKDATAGIYGVRAANGVILITTKTGHTDSDLKININSYAGIQETTRSLPVLNATEYAALANEAFAAGGQALPFPDISNLGKGTDWQKEIFQTAPITSVNLGVNGGGKKSKYAFGTSYLTQDGIVGGSSANFNRFTLKSNYRVDIIKNLTFKSSAIYTKTKRKNLLENTLGSVLFNALNMAPTMTVKDGNGDYTLAEGLGNEVINPAAQIANTYNQAVVNKISGVGGLSYKFLNDFTAVSRIQFNYSEVTGYNFSPKVFYGSGKVFNVDRSSYSEFKNIYRDYTWDSFVTFSKKFNDVHNLKVLLGMTVTKSNGIFDGNIGFDIPDNSFANASLANASDVVNFFINGGNTFDTRLLSYLSRIQYDYKGKYLVSAVIRRDASSIFGPSNKFGYFPSVSLGYVAKDNYDAKFLNFFKLRASYGIIGNDRIPGFRFVSLLNGEGTYVINDELVYGKATGALANPEIKWEKQKTLDIGFDAKFFDSKVNITVDYFKKRTEDLLVVSQVSSSLGASAPGASPPVVNAGIVENKGLEFQIGYQDNISDDFKFNINYNFTTLKNNVLFVDSENGFIPGGSFGVGQDPPSRMEVGHPIGYFYGLKTDGIFQNQAEIDAHATQVNAAPGDIRYVDINGDGVIDSNDRTDLGSPIPTFTMGLNLGFTYKNFDFSTYTYASIGNKIVRNYERNQDLTNRSIYYLQRWTNQGNNFFFPRVTTGANSNTLFSDFYLEDGEFLRVQNIQLGYTLPKKLLEKLKLDKLRVYTTVNNPFTLSHYKGYDPSASNGAPIGGGIDQGFYPVPRTYMLGLNLKF